MFRKFSIVICLFLLVAAKAAAQDGASAREGVLQERIDSLNARIERMERKTSGWDKLLANLPRVSGYAQLRYQWSDDASSFDIRRVRLDLNGRIYRDMASYRVQIEFAGSPKIVDAFVRLTPFRQFNVQAGSFKVPFSIENQVAPLSLGAIDYSMVVQNLVGFSDVCGVNATGRDLGVMAYGGFFGRGGSNVVEYRVGVFNGTGFAAKDDNKSKDISAMLTLRPMRNLQFTGSYYWGQYAASASNRYAPRERWALGGRYDDGSLFVMGEYMRGTTGLEVRDTDFESDGCYVLAGYWINSKISPVVRYEFFARDCNARSESMQTNYMAGLNYKPWRHLLVQVNYTRRTYRRQGQADGNLVGVMVSGIF
ncbi:MAG: OprO/OprP family phosphate-selective porin [Alistipes sp.]|nr:OprO/OprP family phosphate-selective porin [Alistipes sp.]